WAQRAGGGHEPTSRKRDRQKAVSLRGVSFREAGTSRMLQPPDSSGGWARGSLSHICPSDEHPIYYT
ncbi:MAG: hypothetical protein NZM43_07465, partial [Saprospiraceae bacterium]|nr:hypothetical protein [Saprospiraceae bacterium]MDW8484145.1 hypothetical protein [Saprospiraceae bacterium]